MKKTLGTEIIIALLIFLFIYTAFSKIEDIPSFQHAMEMQPFPVWFKIILLWGLPISEMLIAAMLIFVKTRLYGLYGFISLMGIFTTYIILILLRFFHRIPCSCGGVIQRLSWGEHLVFNLVFLVLGYIALRLFKENKRDRSSEENHSFSNT